MEPKSIVREQKIPYFCATWPILSFQAHTINAQLRTAYQRNLAAQHN